MAKSLRFLVLLIGFCFVYDASAQEEDEGDELSKAATLMRKGYYSNAEQIYTKLQKQNPGDVTYTQLLAHSILLQKRFKESDSILFELIEKDSTNPGNYWYLGLSREVAKQDSLAIIWYKKYVQKIYGNLKINPLVWIRQAACYKRLMASKGLTQTECADLIMCYENYITAEPNDNENIQYKKYIDSLKSKISEMGDRLIWDGK